MRKKMFSFKNFVMLFMAIGLLTSVGCSKQDDSNEVDPVKKEVESLKKDFEAKSKALQSQLDQAKKDLQALSSKEGVTKAELDKAKKEVVDLTVAKTAFEAYKTEQTSKEEATNKRISALETLVGENKAALDKALEDLKKDMKGIDVSAQVKELNESIAANKTELTKMLNDYKTANDAKVEGLNKKFAALEEKMNMNVVASLLNSRLTSLVFLPEYVADNGGALPLINFQPLFVTCTDYKVKDKNNRDVYYEYVADGAVLLKYVVNPSSVTEADIDTENLKFFYNDPKVMKKTKAEEISAKAEFVSLKDGVLTVKASADVTESWLYLGRNTPTHSGNPDDRIDQLMLQVPTMAGKNDDDSPKYTMVSSDWAKIVYEEKLPALVKDVTPAPANWGKHVLSSTVDDAKDQRSNDVRIVKLQYDQPLDLKEVVESMMYDKTTNRNPLSWTGWTDLNDEFYNFEFEFDLNYVKADGKTAPIEYVLNINDEVEPTDQQQFIDLKKNSSVVKAKTYSVNDPLRSSIGRTPIVHVMLKSKEDGAESCTVKHGYIKLQIVEKKQDPIFYHPKEGLTHEAGCSEIIYRLGTKGANEELYSLVGLTRDEFSRDYYSVQVEKEDIAKDNEYLNKDGYVYAGDIYLARDYAYSDPSDKLSDNVIYALDNVDQVWANVGKTVWKQAILKSRSGRRDIVVQFAVKIVKEKVELDVLLDSYWYNGFTNTIQNVAVPAKDATDSNLATYANNINNSFVTIKDKNVLNLNNEVKPNEDGSYNYDGYTYEYIFDVTKNQPIQKVKGHKDGEIKITVTEDGKELKATQGSTTETIATIKPQDTDGDILEYNESSELGKWLLNKEAEFMKARVILVVKNKCGKRVDVQVKRLADKDRFNIHFLRPINLTDVSPKAFVDGVGAGNEGSYLNIKEVVNLADWRNIVKNTKEYSFSKHPNFIEYYDVQHVKVDLDNIKTKGLSSNTSELPNTISIDQTPDGQDYKGADDAEYPYGALIYDNNGNNLGKDFFLVVPVTVEYKWGKIQATVEVPVKATSTTKAERKAAK